MSASTYTSVSNHEVCYLVHQYLLTVSPTAATALYTDMSPLITPITTTAHHRPCKPLRAILNEYVQLKARESVRHAATVADNKNVLLNTMQTLITALQQKQQSLHAPPPAQPTADTQTNGTAHSSSYNTDANQFVVPANKRKRKTSPHKLIQRTSSRLSDTTDSDHLLPPTSVLSSPHRSDSNYHNSRYSGNGVGAIGQHSERQVLMDAKGFESMLNSDYPELLAQLINQRAHQQPLPAAAHSSSVAAQSSVQTLAGVDADVSLSILVDESIDQICNSLINDQRSTRYLDEAFVVTELSDSSSDDTDTADTTTPEKQRNGR